MLHFKHIATLLSHLGTMTPEIIDTPEGPTDLPSIGTRQSNTLHALANVPVSISEEETQME
jgi:hypothetical protein